MSKCNKKKKYKTFTKANKVKNRIIGNILFSTLKSYWCHRHECVHLGHNNRMDNKTILLRQSKLLDKFNYLDSLVEINL